MKKEFLHRLWRLRFDKMRKTEEEAAWAYQDMLDKCLVLLSKQDPVIEMLRTLVREERIHEKLAEELGKICQRCHPEVESD
ncbi:MAG: hypothetical protein Q8R76_07345 [Candidatus Omnitrophota bacterium]|nr:hypothetical protein [Candidatus Omnitrophota bacterium]